MGAVRTKRNTKDTVFSSLFGRPEYQLQLYQTLHPEDTAVDVSMLTDVTIRNVLTDNIYNDLGFMVRNRLMILVEAQSTWSENIIIRAFMYLAQSYHELFESRMESLYTTRKIELPEPELYVIYTGERREKPDSITLSGSFFGGKKTALEVTVKVLYGEDRQSIIGQYIRFSKVFDEQTKAFGLTEEAIRRTLAICRDENVLSAYLKEHEKEAVTIMMTLFDEEYIQKAYGAEKFAEGEAKGEARGEAKGGNTRDRLHVRNLRAKHYLDEQIADILDMSLDEVKAIPKD